MTTIGKTLIPENFLSGDMVAPEAMELDEISEPESGSTTPELPSPEAAVSNATMSLEMRQPTWEVRNKTITHTCYRSFYKNCTSITE